MQIFSSIRALADHLQRLMSNEQEYFEYFLWTRGQKKLQQPLHMSLCAVCDFLQQSGRKKSVLAGQSFADYFDPKRRCDAHFARRVLEGG